MTTRKTFKDFAPTAENFSMRQEDLDLLVKILGGLPGLFEYLGAHLTDKATEIRQTLGKG